MISLTSNTIKSQAHANNSLNASGQILQQMEGSYFKLCQKFQKCFIEVFTLQPSCLQQQGYKNLQNCLKQTSSQRLSLLQTATLTMHKIYYEFQSMKRLSENNSFKIDLKKLKVRLIEQQRQNKLQQHKVDETFNDDNNNNSKQQSQSQQTGSLQNSSDKNRSSINLSVLNSSNCQSSFNKKDSFSQLNSSNSNDFSSADTIIIQNQRQKQNQSLNEQDNILKNLQPQENYNRHSFQEQSNFLNYPQHIVLFAFHKKIQIGFPQMKTKIFIKQISPEDYIIFDFSILKKYYYPVIFNNNQNQSQILKNFANGWNMDLKLKWILQCSRALEQLRQLNIKVKKIFFQSFVYSISDGKFKYLLTQNSQQKEIKKQEIKQDQQKEQNVYKKFCQIVLNNIYCSQGQKDNDHNQKTEYYLQSIPKDNSLSQNKSQNSIIYNISKCQQRSKMILKHIMQILSENQQENIFKKFKNMTDYINYNLKEQALSQNSSNFYNKNNSKYYQQNNLLISNYSNRISFFQDSEVQQEKDLQQVRKSLIRKNIDSQLQNFNSSEFKQLNLIIRTLSQFKSTGKELYQQSKCLSIIIDRSNIQSFNQFFKNLSFKEKIRIFLDLFASYSRIVQKIKENEKDKINEQFNETSVFYSDKVLIILNLGKFKYQFDPKPISRRFLKQFSSFLLKTVLIVDDDNKDMPIQQIIDYHFKKAQTNSNEKFLKTKAKYFLFSQNLRYQDNQKIQFALIKFYLSQIMINQKQDIKAKQQYEQFSQMRKQVQKVFFLYQEAGQCQQEDGILRSQENQIQSNFIDTGFKFNLQKQFDTISNVSRLQQEIQRCNISRKQLTVKKIRQTQPKYGKLVTAFYGLIQFQKVYNQHNTFNVYEFEKLSRDHYLDVQFLVLCGHDFGKQGFKILNNIPFKELRVYEVWRNNIQTFVDSDFNKLKNLVAFSGTFNPLRIDTVQYLMQFVFQKMIQLRIQFIDGNISWPKMINQCIPRTFPNLQRIRVANNSQFFKNIKEPFNENTKKIIQSLQAKGIFNL